MAALRGLFLLLCFSLFTAVDVSAQRWTLNDIPELSAFFETQVQQIEAANELTQFRTLQEWEQERPRLREELFQMLGLSPRPDRTPLHAQTTAVTEHEEFVVERLHFQSSPGLYVTASLYRPREQSGPLPAVLYVCGHGRVKENGVSYGSKVHYQHHGAWFARNGYVCLIIDTLQLGEIEGLHHGTYNLNRWWWNSRGYTPAGVEAWNCMRALDYLESRPEVDSSRMGVTGRSGGGAYSWWIAALDDRIQCAVPVAGITSMRDHVIHGCVEGHCDCMFMVNAFRWNFARVAALVAPRPLLISNTDKDSIFPLEGVIDVHRQTRHIYNLYEAGENLGLQITEGPHSDTQELHIHAFRWFNRHFRKTTDQIEKIAVKFFTPQQLQVFTALPADERNTTIDEVFVPAAQLPELEAITSNQKLFLDGVRNQLRDRCLRAWPDDDAPVVTAVTASEIVAQTPHLQRTTISFASQLHVPLQLQIVHQAQVPLNRITSLQLLAATDSATQPPDVLNAQTASAVIVLRPGTIQSWPGNTARQNQIRRRFQLIGTTLDTMRVWDLRQAMRLLRRECPDLQELHLAAAPGSESLAMLATVFESGISSLTLPSVAIDESGLDVLNFSRTIPAELLPVLAALQTTLVTQSKPEQAPLLHLLQQRGAIDEQAVRWGGD